MTILWPKQTQWHFCKFWKAHLNSAAENTLSKLGKRKPRMRLGPRVQNTNFSGSLQQILRRTGKISLEPLDDDRTAQIFSGGYRPAGDEHHGGRHGRRLGAHRRHGFCDSGLLWKKRKHQGREELTPNSSRRFSWARTGRGELTTMDTCHSNSARFKFAGEVTQAWIRRLGCEKGSVGRLRGFIGVLCAIFGIKSRIYRVAFHLGEGSPSQPWLREEEKAPADRWTRAVRERQREEGGAWLAALWARTAGPLELDAGGSLGHGLVPGRLSPPFFLFFLFPFANLFQREF